MGPDGAAEPAQRNKQAKTVQHSVTSRPRQSAESYWATGNDLWQDATRWDLEKNGIQFIDHKASLAHCLPVHFFIGVGTGGARGHSPHFFAKIILQIFPSFLKYNFDTENDPPGRGEHKSALKCIVDGLVFAGDEIEVSLAPLTFCDVPTPLHFLQACGWRQTLQIFWQDNNPIVAMFFFNFFQ